jgi:hypothetical protein
MKLFEGNYLKEAFRRKLFEGSFQKTFLKEAFISSQMNQTTVAFLMTLASL